MLREANLALLKTIGPVVRLKADPEVIFGRIKSETHRPLLDVPDPKAEIRQRLADREPFYNKAADHTVETTQLTPSGAAKEISEWLRSKSS